MNLVRLFGTVFCQFLTLTLIHSQNIDATVDYINARIEKNSNEIMTLSVSNDGIVTVMDEKTLYGGNIIYKAYTMSPFDISVSIQSNNQLSIKCNTNVYKYLEDECISVYIITWSKVEDSESGLSITFITKTTDEGQYVVNAFNHLIDLAKDRYSKAQLEKAKTDPFATPSFETSGVQMTKVGNLYEVPVELNGVLRIKFLLDTGASDLFLSPDVFLTLVRSGTLSQDDYLGSSSYSIANGETEVCKNYKLKSVKIGHKTISDVACAVANTLEVDMLLGQSFLSKLGSYRIDNTTNKLIID